MLIPFGVFSAAGAGGGGVAGDYELISTNLVASSTSAVSVSLAGLSAYKHLQLRITAQGTSTNANIYFTFNSDSGNNYSWHTLFGDGSNVNADSSVSRANIVGSIPVVASSNTNQFTASIIDIVDAFSATKNKTTRSLNGRASSGGNWVAIDSGAWFNTNALTQIDFGITGGAINAGSRFSLFGLKG